MVALYSIIVLGSGLTAIFLAQYWGDLTGNLAHPPEKAATAQVQGSDAGASDQDQAPQSSPEKAPPASRFSNTELYFVWMGLALLVLVLMVLQGWFQSRMDLLMSNHLRARVFAQVLRQDPEFFHSYDPGRLNMVINMMTVETQMLLRQVLVDPFLQLVLFLVTVRQIILNLGAILDRVKDLTFAGFQVTTLVPVAGGLILAIAMLSPFLISRMSVVLRSIGRQVQRVNMDLASLVTGAGGSPEEIQLMEAVPFFSNRFKSILDRSIAVILKNKVSVATLNVVDQLPTNIIKILFVGTALVLSFGATGAAGGTAALVGSIITIVALIPQLMEPFQTISQTMVIVSQSWPSAETIFSILDRKARSDDSPDTSDIQIVEPSVEVKDVTFSYAPDLPPVFRGLSFTLPTGQRTAFIAGMGQGKTSFFRLTLRFYDPQDGEILIGGKSTRKFTQESIRRQVSMMSQFPAFFNASLRDNLLIAKPAATDKELLDLCELTSMAKIMAAKRLTLDSPLMAGNIFSGGQKKILALTRCLLRDPKILFLDEPTAGVDNTEKFFLMHMIQEATKGKTLIVVDHDVNWLLQLCDYFIGMDNGAVVEQGNLEQILLGRGLIFKLYTAAMGPKTEEISRNIAEANKNLQGTDCSSFTR